jgi:protein TonB
MNRPAMFLPPLPAAPADVLGPNARRGLALGMLAAHLAAGWALLQIEPVRQALGTVAPIVVDLLAPPAPEVPPAPPPPPPRLEKPPTPRPIIAAPPAPTPLPPEAPVFEAPPPPPEPPAPEPVVAVAPPAPPPPAPAPEPKTIPATAVDYLTPPVLTYPAQSQRRGEHGRVLVRVLVDARGAPQKMSISRSSGFARLDEAALAAVRATRFKPHTENGVALPFWVLIPLVFEIEG